MRIIDHVSFRCPQCFGQITKSVMWLQANRECVCPHCGARIILDKDQVSLLLAQLERSEFSEE